MWSSGHGSGSRSCSGSDPERERRGARRWTYRGISPPASFRRSASFSSSYAGSSSSSGAGLLPVKREWSEDEEEPEERTVKEEPEEPASLGRRGVVGPEDYVADVDSVAATIAKRSADVTSRSSKTSSDGRRSPPTSPPRRSTRSGAGPGEED
ncbi:CDPK-related protein kinase [Hordeum vulgare]|nr:CDPK-related protein kinase [Hordeum vulgare]